MAAPQFSGDPTPLNLSRGSFPVWIYAPDPAKPVTGIIVFGSGDGGWTKVEEHVCRSLTKRGFLVGGIDFRQYADQAYNWDILASDFQTITTTLLARSPVKNNLVFVYGGFSTGAEQSIAAAAHKSRPESLKYLLLMAPGKRGRFGMTMADLMGMTPKGPNTFALTDYASQMKGLRIVQFHGEHDPLDSTDWLKGLQVPNKLFVTPGGWHTYHGADDAFLVQLNNSVDWLLGSADHRTGSP